MAKEDMKVKGDMTVREAGEKGGKQTSLTHDKEHYEEIGRKGGSRVSESVDKGRQSEADSPIKTT